MMSKSLSLIAALLATLPAAALAGGGSVDSGCSGCGQDTAGGVFTLLLILVVAFVILVLVGAVRDAYLRKTNPEYRANVEERDREWDQIHRGHGGKP